MIIGSLEPRKSWMSVESPAATSEVCTISVLSAAESPARSEMIIAGVTQPTIMTTRCCSAMGSAKRKPGKAPSSWNRESSFPFILRILPHIPRNATDRNKKRLSPSASNHLVDAYLLRIILPRHKQAFSAGNMLAIYIGINALDHVMFTLLIQSGF